jgi:hydroxylamine reductase (hybrid-cluster protein)
MNTENLDSIKIDLIVHITKLNDEDLARQIKDFVEDLEKRPTEKQSEMLKKMAKPMRKKLDIEELKREQNWKPIDRDEFDRLIKEIDIQEPLEQLIADIGK